MCRLPYADNRMGPTARSAQPALPESRMMGNYHVRFGEGDGETRRPRGRRVRPVPTLRTGGFLLAAHDAIAARHAPLDRDQQEHLRHKALHGWEIVDNTARRCVMNLYLHGIGVDGSTSPITVGDSLAADPGARFEMVLTNPPF